MNPGTWGQGPSTFPRSYVTSSLTTASGKRGHCCEEAVSVEARALAAASSATSNPGMVQPTTTMSSFRRWMGLATSSPQPFCRGCPDASRIIHCTKQVLPNLLPQVPSSGDMAEELAARDWTSQPGYRIASLLTSTGYMNFSFKGFVLLLG